MADRPERQKEKRKKKKDGIRPEYLVLGAVVIGLVGLVWWSLPSDKDKATAEDGGAETAATVKVEGDASAPKTSIDRPGEAAGEIAVLTDKGSDVIHKEVSLDTIAAGLDVRHCGAQCDAVKKLMHDEDRVEIDVRTSDDYILPPKDTIDTLAPGLTPEERSKVHSRATAVVVRVSGPVNVNHVPARTLFAIAAYLAEKLDGFVYDEAVRRVETSSQALEHAIKVPLGQPVFQPGHIRIMFFREEEGTARLVTLGMIRFGLPDLVMRGASMATGSRLHYVINAVAHQLVAEKLGLPITVTLDDVARALGKKREELATKPDASKSLRLDAVDAQRVEGDPENQEISELVPASSSREEARVTREAWDEAVIGLFGTAPEYVEANFGSKLEELATRTRRDLPGVIKKFEGGQGELLLWSRFPVPPESRSDGGPATESLWIQVASCDTKACSGTPTGSPVLAANVAMGKTTSVPRDKVDDWLMRLPDGGTAGGESIKILRGEAREARDAGAK
jgi:hypothetical protein